MNFLTWLTPGFLRAQIRTIDAEALEYRLQRERHPQPGLSPQLQVWVVIGVACLCLLLVHYGKYSSNLRDLISWLDTLTGQNGQWRYAYRTSEYRELFGYVWWGGIHLLGFLLIPLLAVRFWLKEPLKHYGLQWGRVHEHWPGYLLLATPIMVFAIIASFTDGFSQHYPFYKQASRSWSDLLLWEAIYIAQFVTVEFFFRGFLVNGLRRQFGSLSVAVMCLPYLMLHFPKLWPESFGAILFGFFLGVLALMSRSIWGGVMVHVAIALTMDIAALLQTGGLPERW
ncbi:MAG TPA: CPBP family intramembrane metalloprotease [Oceanospirillales bacterium]|nr:CPBP family intramembrane metalloprotease [Oceanospirillaceae bacterium]HBS42272.1 CPBP family intramembrane metalloprotease [Oceanospirillales bacterium]|tara:strand:+ start:4347 stop:5198 length:852 start_codon:yes stop_codon:yes gene_type:complete